MSDSHNASFFRSRGSAARTPYLDGLADQGIRFESAWCPYPLCAPSRACLFGGRYAHELGAWSNAFPWDGKPDGWPRALRRGGALLAAVGKMHLLHGAETGVEQEMETGHIDPARRVDLFSFYRDTPPVRRENLYVHNMWNSGPRPAGEPYPPHVASARRVTDRAAEWLRRERPADRPWVLYVGHGRPHPPWNPRQSVFDRCLASLPRLADKYLQPIEDLHPMDQVQALHTCAYDRGVEDLRRAHAAYHGAVEELDEEVGRLLAVMDELDLRRDTLIIYSTDHGEMARAHGKWGKLSLYEDSVRVPLIVAGPGVAQGRVERAPVSLLDVPPTIAEAVGVAAPPELRGRSLMSLARGRADPGRPPFVFAEIHGNAWPCAAFAVRRGRWKLMEYLGQRPALYDLEQDSDEMHDLVKERGEGDAKVAARLAELRADLRSVCDPEEVDRRARQDTQRLKERMEASGLLAQLLWKEGFERDTRRLIPRA